MTKIEACNTHGKSLSDGIKECKGKTGSEACTCFTNETLKTHFDELKKCDYKVNILHRSKYLDSLFWGFRMKAMLLKRRLRVVSQPSGLVESLRMMF